MNKELLDLLTAYLSGWKTVFDCDEWLAGVDWNDPKLDTENRSVLGRLELLVTEVAEGLRQEIEFAQEASVIVAKETNSLYVTQPSLTDLKTVDSSNDSVVRTPEINVTSGVGAQSWSISPLELFSKLNDYLERRITLWDLESWLAPRLPIFLDTPDSVVGRMAGAIELCIAELQDGLKSERTVKRVLKRYQEVQTTFWISSEPASQSNVTTSVMSTILVEGLMMSQFQIWSNEPQGVNA